VSAKKYRPKSGKVRSDEEALDIAAGGPLTARQPYSGGCPDRCRSSVAVLTV
jgi:hypothetical protein